MNRPTSGRAGPMVVAVLLVGAACTADTPSTATRIDGSMTALRAPPRQVVDDPCVAAEPGWEQGPCRRLPTMAVGAQRRFDGSAIPIWRVTVWTPDGDAWSAALDATGPADTWAEITIGDSAIAGGALVVGYRYAGSGAVLDYDIVTASADVIAHRSGLEHASVDLAGDVIEEYAADPGSEDPTCCPQGFVHTTISYDDGAVHATPRGIVPVDERPGSDL